MGFGEECPAVTGYVPLLEPTATLQQGELPQGASVRVLSILESSCGACAFCQKSTSVQHYLQSCPVCPGMPLIQPLGIRLFPVQRQPLAFLCPEFAIEVLFGDKDWCRHGLPEHFWLT